MVRRIGFIVATFVIGACGSDGGTQGPEDTSPDTANDTAGDTSDGGDTVTPDSDVAPTPTLAWSSPNEGACVSSEVITVSGSATHADGLVLRLVGVGPGDAAIDAPLGSVTADTWSGTWSPLADGPHTLSVVAEGDLSAGPVGFTVDRVAPVIALEAPVRVDGVVEPDADPIAEGYQVRVVARITEATSLEGGEVCLAVDGGSPSCQAMAAEVPFVVSLEAGRHSLSASATDGCGLAAEPVTADTELAFDNPVAIVGPAGTLLARDDEDPTTTTSYETTFMVAAERVVVGASVTIECRPTATGGYLPVIVQQAETIDSPFAVGASLDTEVFGHDVECRARLDLPAAGVSEPVALTLAIPAPSAAFGALPACVNTDLAVAGTAGGLDGRALAVALGDAPPVSFTVADGTFSGTLALGDRADGDYTLSLAGTDAWGNDLADHGAPSATVAIDRTAPVVSVVGSTDPVTAESDSDTTRPGMQVDVTLAVVEARPGGEVCLGLDGVALGCRPVVNGQAVFEDVTIQGGANAFVATAADACGNAATPASWSLFHTTEAPVVTITTPAADLATAASDLDFTVSVTEPDRVTPLAGLAVRLFAGTSELAAEPLDLGDGTYRFEGVALPEGVTTTFTSHAARPGSVGVSGPRAVTQKNVTPTIAVTVPVAGPLNLASTICTGAPGCDLTVTAQTTAAEDGSQAELDVVCGASSVKHTASVTGAAASFAVSLPAGSCTLTPTVVDLVGQRATGQPVAVLVDRVAPTVAIASLPDVLLAQHDVDSATPGIQSLLRADVGGVAAGTTVTATLTWGGAAPGTRTLTHTVATTTPDGGTYTATFEDTAGGGRVTWPEGVVTLRISLADVAGNPASTTRLVTVDSEASVRITGPTTNVANQCTTSCAAGSVCHQGTCWLTWGENSARQLVAVVAGLDTTSANLRICSDAPAFEAAGAAPCASTHPSGGVFRQVQVATAAAGINALDVSQTLGAGHHRVVVEVRPHDGGAWVSSHFAATSTERERRLYLDLTAPVITSVTSPSDTLPPIGTLNAAEQKSTPRVYDIAFTTDEAGSADIMVNGTVAATRAVAVGSTTVPVTLPEGSPQVWVIVTDHAGNRSRLSPALGATTYAPLVDVTPPSLGFNRPNTTPLKAGDNLDVIVASSAEGRTVTLSDHGAVVASAPVTGGVATFPHATHGVLSDGLHRLTASVSDAAGNPASAATLPNEIFVDTVPPLGTISSPAHPTQLTDLEDADPNTQGFQVAVDFATTRGAVSWSLWTASGCNVEFNNCAAPVQRGGGAVTNPDGAEPRQWVTLDLTSIVTQHRIIIRTVDATGNTHETFAGVQVLVMSCAISFRSMPTSGWFNGQHCATPPSCATTTVEVQVGVVGLCGADTIRLFDGDTQLGPDRNQPGSLERFYVDVNDGDSLVLEARAFADGQQVGSTGQLPMGVDLTPPVTRFVATSVAGFTTPAAGATPTYRAADDLDRNTAGMQLHLAVEVADDNIGGGAITALSATGSTTVALSPSNVTFPWALVGDSPVTTSLLDVTLASGQSHVVSVTARDAAGNTSTSSFQAIVDVVAPSAVTLQPGDPDPRGPKVTLTWNAVGDDANVGTVTSYEVRYSKVPLSEANWSSACDASQIHGSEAMGAPPAAGTVMSRTFGGPDSRPFTDPCKFALLFEDAIPGSEPAFYFGVRAIDDVGNVSPLLAGSTWTATRGELMSKTSRVRFDNRNNAFGSTNLSLLTRRGALLGDIDGDGLADWATGSRNSQAFCVVRGKANPPAETVIDTMTGPDHACLIGANAGVLFAGATQTGHYMRALGDINGDGLADFGISGKLLDTASNSNLPGEGYVAIWLGRQGQMPDLTAPNIRIRGLRTRSGALEFLGFCGAGDFDGVPSNGRMTGDIALGEAFDSKVHVIPGQGTWDTNTNITINVATAGELAAHGAWTVQATGVWGTGSGSPAQLGVRCARGGDILPTPAGMGTGAKDDLVVYQQGSLDARVFIFPGREFTPGTVESVSECVSGDCSAENPPVVTAEDLRSVRLRQEVTGMLAGYGGSFHAGNDLTGDGVPDVLVTHPGRSIGATGTPDGKSLYVFDGARAAALVGTDVRIEVVGDLVGQTWTGANGWVLRASVNGQPGAVRAVGDFDERPDAGGQPTFDIVFGGFSGTNVEVRLNHSHAAMGLVPGQFAVMDGSVTNRFSAASSSIGQWLDGGMDLDGDGRVDMVTGGNVGDVLIVH